MKRTLLAIAAGVLTVSAAGTAIAAMPTKADVIARDAKGKAIEVRVNGQDYKVCTDGVTDSCINPRQAGLHFGNVPLDHWPGKPASQM